ncbi:olfactory receptor 12D2-like [Pelobates fuscus]
MIVSHLIGEWQRIKKLLKISTKIIEGVNIRLIERIIPDMNLSKWRSEREIYVKDLLQNKKLLPFKDLKSNLNLPDTEIFPYLRARGFINESLLRRDSGLNNLVYKIFEKETTKSICSMAMDLIRQVYSDIYPTAKKQWEKDFNIVLTDKDWCLQHSKTLENQSSLTEFILLGLTDVSELKVILFVCFLMLYILTLVGNISIMVVTLMDNSLHTPMYFFLWNLSFLDICYSSVAVPKMLVNFLSVKTSISFAGCISQMHFFHFFGSTEVILYSAMSYDRYVAIGYPLRYTNIMNSKVCINCTFISWFTGFFHALLHSVMTSRLPFCGPNLVSHFFCDIKPLLSLACADTFLNIQLLNMVTGTLTIITLFLTLLSYLFIGRILIKIKTTEGRKRAFSTCSAHLTAVSLQYGTALFIYMRPSTQDSLNQEKAAAVLFAVITPLLNPIIYTLRNKDMKKALYRVSKKLFLS